MSLLGVGGHAIVSSRLSRIHVLLLPPVQVLVLGGFTLVQLKVDPVEEVKLEC